MVEYFSVNSYDAFVHQITRLSENPNKTITLFCGALDANGQSWCPDCRNAIPVIQEVLQSVAVQNVPLNYLFVGIERNEWKDPNNNYKMDKTLRLTNVPTLILWEHGQEKARLVEKECSVLQLLVPFFRKY